MGDVGRSRKVGHASPRGVALRDRWGKDVSY